jgi:hypothetical protein
MASILETNSKGKPPVLQNWLARIAGEPSSGMSEFPIYTDAHITGEIRRNDWPYSFLNAVPFYNEPGIVKASVILRVNNHLSASVRPDFSKTDTSTYHGGHLTDELAAIASLCVGARMRAGGASRHFEKASSDPFGQPVAWDPKPTPSLQLDKNRLVLPNVVGSHSLEELTRMEWLLRLDSRQSVSLVRAARLYQDALWIAESDPALAWLMLVSALETGANEWRASYGSPVERLSYSKPELIKYLQNVEVEGLIETVARQFVDSLGATKKFVEFALEFLPPPPEARPVEWLQVLWEEEEMTTVLKKVYGYRSKALHAGTPFPAPMCDPPYRFGSDTGFAEKGTVGLAASTRGGTWRAEDLPISLHAFHYVARGVLLGWWECMKDGNTRSENKCGA